MKFIYMKRLSKKQYKPQSSQSFHRVRREVTFFVSNLCELCLISVSSVVKWFNRLFRQPLHINLTINNNVFHNTIRTCIINF